MTQRTVTYKINFDLAGVKNGNRSMQVTLRSMEQDANKAKVSMQQLADSVGKKYGVQTKVAIDDTKTFKNALREQAREANRAERNFESLTREYQHMATRVKLSRDEQEVLNAQFRLGAGATEAQRQEVAELVREYQRLRAEATKTQGSMRSLRGQAQNVGFQLQDIAVQAQMGTNALVILGQQGSQLAAGFGAKGALVGAFIAVAAAITFAMIPSLKDGGKQIEELTDKIKEFSKTALLTKSQAAFLENEENKRIEDYRKEIEKAEKQLATLAEQAEITSRVAKDTLRNVDLDTPEGMQKYSDLMKVLNRDLAENQEQAQATIDTNNMLIAESESAIESYRLRVAQTGEEQEKLEQQQAQNIVSNAEMVRTLQEQAEVLGMTGSQIAVINKQRAIETLRLQEAGDAEIRKVEAAYDAIVAHEIATEAANIRQQAEAAVAKSIDEAAQAEARRLAVTAKYTDAGRLEALDAQMKEELKAVGENEEAIAAIHEHYANERIKINGNAWEQYAIQAQEALLTTDEIMTRSLDRFVSSFGDAMTQMVFDSASPGEALRNMFEAGLRSMVQFFSEWAAQKLLIWALDKTLGKTAQAGHAAAATSTSSAKVIEAGLNAFTSTAAIPIIGPVLAPGAAAAAVSATAPMAASIAALQTAAIGVYDKGGRIPAGGAGIVAEIGDELVGGTMVYNGSPNSLGVTGREDTARQTGGGGMSVGGIVINSSGNASPEAIGRAVVRALERKNKRMDTAIYDSMNRGKSNRGKRFNA